MTRPSAFLEILRGDFSAFIQASFQILNPGTPFQHNWHLDAFAADLEDVRSGNCRCLIGNMPPRSLKSHCVSIAWVAWLLGCDPTVQIITVSYSQELSEKFARDCRLLMSSDLYRELFPQTQLSPFRQAVNEFETTQGGFRLSTSIGGPLTGRGADIIIIDDPLKPEEALSDAQRERVNDWFANTLFSRLNDKARGKIVLVMQRLHEDDLSGRLLAQGGWRHASYPAIAERDEEYHWLSPYGPRCHRRKAGSALHSAREPLSVLSQIRQTIGAYSFAGQYQQAPTPAGGGIVRTEWFGRYTEHEVPNSFDYKLQSWDTANKPGELANYTVCTTWGIKGDRVYLLHVLRRRLGYLDLKAMARGQAINFQPKVILIEDRASGTQLIQDLNAQNVPGVVPYKPEGDKVMRMSIQAAAIENGEVCIPNAAPWLDDYLHEIGTFPKGRFSDQVDSTSQALDWIKSHRGMSGTAAFNYLMAMARKSVAAVRPAMPTRLMQAPPSVQSSRLNDGRLLIKREEDGLFEVPEDAVPLLITAGWRLSR